MTRQWVSLPNPLKNPLLTNMNRIVDTFEFPCNPPFRIWMRALPEALFQVFWTVVEPTPKQIIKAIFGHSWLCETKQILKRGIPVEVGVLTEIGEVFYVTIEVAEGVAFWYWVVQVTIDFIILWSTLARRASVCGGFGWMDAYAIDWGVTDNGEWQRVGWTAWKTGGDQVHMNGFSCSVPNGASYSTAVQVTGGHFIPPFPASIAARVVEENGNTLAETQLRQVNAADNTYVGNFDHFTLSGTGVTGLHVECKTDAGAGNFHITKGNWVVSAVLNMKVPT